MDLNRRNFLRCSALGSAALIFDPQASFAKNPVSRITGYAFGSTWTATLDKHVEPGFVRRQIEIVLTAIDQSMSPYRPNSEISRFNMMPSSNLFAPSAAFHEVSKAALEMAVFTNGAFDPTVGPKVNARGFGPIKGTKDVDWRALTTSGQQLAKADSAATLDICGIAKGYALDVVRAVLLRNNIQNASIEIGGEIATIGGHPDGRPWRVAIESPEPYSTDALCVIEPRNYCVATSGHKANGIVGPIFTSHIVSPKGKQLSNTLSVSVLAKTGMYADALATALCAMDTEEAIEFGNANAINALLSIRSDSGIQLVTTGQFDQHIIGRRS